MLLEFDADQRLWQETVRDAVGKQCPPALVRGVAEDGVDPAPVWKAYVEHGWTEMSDPENAVELAIVLEELGRATDPTPFLATMSQFAPLVGDRFDPRASGTAVYSGITRAPRRRRVGTRRHRPPRAGRRSRGVACGGHRCRGVRRQRRRRGSATVQTAQRRARPGAACRRPDLQRDCGCPMPLACASTPSGRTTSP